MAWIDRTASSVKELAGMLLTISTTPFLCRGQSRVEWEHLTTSFTRAIEHRHKIEPHVSAKSPRPHITIPLLEVASIARFIKQGHMHLNRTESGMLSTVVGTLSLMQHYGAPTRLLDWTSSPWVAAYFAAIDDRDRDGAIWSFDANALLVSEALDKDVQGHLDQMNNAADPRAWVEATNTSHNVAGVIHTLFNNRRMTGQQSAYTMAATLYEPHDILIEEMIAKDRRVKIIIKSGMKAELVRHLECMNINQYSLFGGAEGVGRMIRDDIQWGDDITTNYQIQKMIVARSGDTDR